MAFVSAISAGGAALLASVGGGSAVAGALTLATVAGGAYSAIQQRRAGQITEQQMKMAAEREGDAARQQEIERRRDLQKAIGARIAIAGASGITGEGSILSMSRADIRNNRNDLLVDSANAAARMRALRSRGANARREGNARAVSSLLDSANTLYEARG